MRGWLQKVGLLVTDRPLPKNRFSINEFSGAVGDLGTLLPLSFALIVFNGFTSGTIFFLFGLVYLVSGWFYRVPVSVQPLKAMSVIAIAAGFSPAFLASTAFTYGVLFVFLSVTGLIKWLQKWFSDALVRGIQLGIGLILIQKALELVWQKGLLLPLAEKSLLLSFELLVFFLLVIWYFQIYSKVPVTLFLLFATAIGAWLLGVRLPATTNDALALKLHLPELNDLKKAFIFLIIPQLPLTLGNAVYAANDACHTLWGRQAKRVTPSRLAFSIGIGDMFIGLFGGFPMCHGSGGMGAHAQFGAKTGGATMIMGALLIITALIAPLRHLIFLIPVPLLAAMLIFDSYRMIIMVRKLQGWSPVLVALLVGGLSFATHNLTFALIAGFVLEKLLAVLESQRLKAFKGVQND